MSDKIEETGEKIRLDKWLWHARFFKTRTLAGKVCKSGKVRLNGAHIAKASVLFKTGDVLTFPKENDIKVVRMLLAGERRGPAPEAQTLYEDLTPKSMSKAEKIFEPQSATREMGAGRPTKAERRAIDKLMDRD